MSDRMITIKDYGSNIGEVLNILTEVYEGDTAKAMTALQSLPQSLSVTTAQLERLRAIGATVEAMDETVVMSPIGEGFDGTSASSAGGGLNGVSLFSGYIADWMVNDKEHNCVAFDDALLLMVDEIKEMPELFPILQYVLNNNMPLLILASSISDTILQILANNKKNGLIDVACVLVDDAESVFAEASSKFGGQPVLTRSGQKLQQIGAQCLGDVKFVRISKDLTILEDKEMTAQPAEEIDPIFSPEGFRATTDEEDAAAEAAAKAEAERQAAEKAERAEAAKAEAERLAKEQAAVPSVAPAALDDVFEDSSVEAEQSTYVPQGASAKSDAWDGWDKLPDGHAKAVKAMRSLRDHVNKYRAELKSIRQALASDKANSQNIYDSVSTEARNICTRDCTNADNEYRANCDRAEQARRTVGDVVGQVSYFAESLPNISSVREAARKGQDNVSALANEVNERISRKVALYGKLRSSQIATAERIRNDKLDRARKEQIDRDETAERNFKSKNKETQNACRDDIAKGFNKDTVRAYSQEVSSSRFNAEAFECPKSVPDYVMLGRIGLILPEQDADDISVVQAVDLQTSACSMKLASEYDIEMPYAQRLSDGISLLMRYAPKDRHFVQSRMQSLLLKLFMSFPAGKVEATMIDPLDIGANFPDIPKLGNAPGLARLIDTKIWSTDKDIEKSISTFRQRLETMTQAYGEDRESRLKKEPVRVLAITDFPTNFTGTALKDLHAIVRNSASLGVCVFICANDKELANLEDKYGALFDEIMQNMVQTRADGTRLLMTSQGDASLYLKLDDMSDVEARKDDIITTIVETTIHSGPGRLEQFESLFRGDIYDSNNWFGADHTEIAVPIGIKGANTVVNLVVGRSGGSTEHHALVAGPTGAGKSTFLHTLILSTMISYSPDEVQMYLLDFKEGVEFNIYTKYRLPSLRVVAINSEREFGLNVLKELENELERRSKHFTRYGVSDISDYQKLDDVPAVPKLLLIFDEVHELFRSKGDSDSITAECMSCLQKLVTQGRGMGIHIILATQDFHNCAGIESLFSQMLIRIAIKGSEEGASSILSSDNKGSRSLQNQSAGAAIYNNGGGVEWANNFFQVAFPDEDTRKELLGCLDEYYTDPDIAPMYEDYQTRVLLTNAEENIHNSFNQLILRGPESIEPLGDGKGGYGLMLGQGFGSKSIFVPKIRRANGDNMLIVTKNEKMALSMFELAAMSVLYDELSTDADKANALVYIADLFDGELDKHDCDFDYFTSQFPQQMKTAKPGEIRQLVDDLYEIVMGRAEGSMPSDERVFFMLFGLNLTRELMPSGIYDGYAQDGVSYADKVRKILELGPRLGVNSIIWSESVEGTEKMLGNRFDSLFNQRIAYNLPAPDMKRLVEETDAESLKGKTAVYMNMLTDIRNTHFRPYEIPAKVWIARYAEVYDEIANGGGYEA